MGTMTLLAVSILTILTIPLTHSLECKKSMMGGGYSGPVNQTRSALTCQRWDSQEPNTHLFTDPKNFPDDTMDDVANRCRNPDLKAEGVWCFTTDTEIRWEYCDVPDCPVFPECKITEEGVEYRGSLSQTQSGSHCFPADSDTYCRNPDTKPGGPWCYTDAQENWEYCDVPFCKVSSSCKNSQFGQEYVGTISVTGNGRPCQQWDKQFPHSHPYTDSDLFPDNSLEDANNYCRNPDDSPGGLWCYTQDPDLEREFCDIPLCQDCKVSIQGKEYAGTMAMTNSAETCQRWDSQFPHPHNMTDINRYPDASLENAANYCRNPDSKSGGPWCYTTNASVEWEYCDIPACQECEEHVPPFRNVRHVVQFGLDGFAPCFIDSPLGAPNIMQRIGAAGTYTISGARTVLQSWSGPAWMASQSGADTESTGVTRNTWRPPWKGYIGAITPTTGNDIPFPTVYRTLKAQNINIRTASFYDWDWHHYIMNYGDPNSLDLDHYCDIALHGGVTRTCDTFLANNASEYLRQALVASESSYTFVYFDAMDNAGHTYGWCSENYLDSVDFVDSLVGTVLDTIDEAMMADEVLILLSSDHGGIDFGHGCHEDACLLIPLFIRGPGIKADHEFVNAVRNQDIVPTALYAMGYKLSPWWTGQVLFEAFDD